MSLLNNFFFNYVKIELNKNTNIVYIDNEYWANLFIRLDWMLIDNFFFVLISIFEEKDKYYKWIFIHYWKADESDLDFAKF